MFDDVATILTNFLANISDVDFLVYVAQQTSLRVTGSVQEVLKLDNWKTKPHHLEVNIFLLLCITLLLEAVILLLVWSKYSAKIRTVRNLSQQISRG